MTLKHIQDIQGKGGLQEGPPPPPPLGLGDNPTWLRDVGSLGSFAEVLGREGHSVVSPTSSPLGSKCGQGAPLGFDQHTLQDEAQLMTCPEGHQNVNSGDCPSCRFMAPELDFGSYLGHFDVEAGAKVSIEDLQATLSHLHKFRKEVPTGAIV
ncbi:unnamed protein product [Calypogeia fissa]